jgi:hypothetical protein
LKDIVPVWPAKIENGRLAIYDLDLFNDYCRSLSGNDIEVVVRKSKRSTTKPGSDAQRRYYWPVIIGLISDHTGDDEDSTHEDLKVMFAPKVINKQGKRVRVTYSDMTTVQREEYHMKIRKWAAETFGIFIPLPNEVEYD